MVKLKHESDLLQQIAKLDKQQKILGSVGLSPQDSRSNVVNLISTTRQRLNATEFYLEAIMNTDYTNHLGSLFSSSEATEWKPLLGFSYSDLRVQIDLLNRRDTFPLVVFILLNGFFSSLISVEDCLAKIINIVYALIPYNKKPYYGSKVRQKLEKKIPTGKLTRHLSNFHVRPPRDDPARKGYFFNIAKEIRNQLTHDDITDVVDFPSPPPMTLSGFGAEPDLSLRFNAKFFLNPDTAKQEMVVFCQSAFDEKVAFVDECYRLIYRKLRNIGGLPV